MRYNRISNEIYYKAELLGYEPEEYKNGFIEFEGKKYILVNKYGWKWVFYPKGLLKTLANQSGCYPEIFLENKYSIYDKILAEQLTVEQLQYLIQQREEYLAEFGGGFLDDDNEEEYLRKLRLCMEGIDMVVIMKFTNPELYARGLEKVKQIIQDESDI